MRPRVCDPHLTPGNDDDVAGGGQFFFDGSEEIRGRGVISVIGYLSIFLIVQTFASFLFMYFSSSIDTSIGPSVFPSVNQSVGPSIYRSFRPSIPRFVRFLLRCYSRFLVLPSSRAVLRFSAGFSAEESDVGKHEKKQIFYSILVSVRSVRYPFPLLSLLSLREPEAPQSLP